MLSCIFCYAFDSFMLHHIVLLLGCQRGGAGGPMSQMPPPPPNMGGGAIGGPPPLTRVLWVGGLGDRTSESVLRKIFSEYGMVLPFLFFVFFYGSPSFLSFAESFYAAGRGCSHCCRSSHCLCHVLHTIGSLSRTCCAQQHGHRWKASACVVQSGE